jgi:hypothetical protein
MEVKLLDLFTWTAFVQPDLRGLPHERRNQNQSQAGAGAGGDSGIMAGGETI